MSLPMFVVTFVLYNIGLCSKLQVNKAFNLNKFRQACQFWLADWKEIENIMEKNAQFTFL